ncbi:thioredoxin domain-containing protein [Salinibacillus xinjiangensis]|uniref:DUF255 domain-containing protein n=1 Tax=Salinibacillus xinjiangensis TaxID=1229268 RepID=A0A6G1X3X8_9BACI|nr:thioredoxin domain-containing protein [Salinibacillus xinjiangensis]MRG85664.1 DUF255 domain-containing protein [Salinibacillus xinjiangensis]
MSSEQRAANRLIDEKSPYLLQHAYNPVNWFPWGQEAFAKARKENKPIFLSIGYSTCHWCHVMAHESFEDEEMAQLLNERFISIKVDREERPDIDSVYMKVCQMMTGQGGWPLSVFLTPDLVPFYAGTYFPKESKYGRPGFKEVVTQLYQKYKEDPEHISEVTESVTNALEKIYVKKGEKRLTKEVTDRAFHNLGRMLDVEYGGFGGAPKFPAPHNLMYLLRYYHVTGKLAALQMVERTLKSMADGGLYDHIGYGFTRYSTDQKWLVPHFEKMLYDNAMLLMAYTECYQITKKPFYKEISEQIIEFVMREMTNDAGAFYSAIDADSEGVEGKYYVWEYEEVFDVLGEDLGELFAEVYGITSHGNFEGKNIPNLIDTDLPEIAEKHSISLELLKDKLEQARGKLFEERSKRVYPHLDDKVLTAWNALMIAALAKASKVYGENKYLKAAKKALSFIQQQLVVDGRLMVRYRDGQVQNKAFIDDYAFLLWAHVELYEATYDISYLDKSESWVQEMIDLFWDEEHGGFYFYGSDSESLITREKEIYDGAIPSGNSVAAFILTKLGYLTGHTEWLEQVEEMYYTFQESVNDYATGSTQFLQSLLLTEFTSKEVVILGDRTDKQRQELLIHIQKHFLPNVAVLVGESEDQLGNIAPFTKEYRKIEGQTTIYVCENFACQRPTTDIDVALSNIFG